MLMMAKNASNILIYPSQMDFFRLLLEGFSGLALSRSDLIVSLVAFALWFFDFSLVPCRGSGPHFIRATTCAALTISLHDFPISDGNSKYVSVQGTVNQRQLKPCLSWARGLLPTVVITLLPTINYCDNC